MITQHLWQLARPVALCFEHAMGALASGATIFLYEGNSMTETGKQVMRNAAEARGLDVIF